MRFATYLLDRARNRSPDWIEESGTETYLKMWSGIIVAMPLQTSSTKVTITNQRVQLTFSNEPKKSACMVVSPWKNLRRMAQAESFGRGPCPSTSLLLQLDGGSGERPATSKQA